MTKFQTYCDECGRPKSQDDTGWRDMGVTFESKTKKTVLSVVIGDLRDERWDELHNTCGESCLHRHIDKLLQPATIQATTPSSTTPPSASPASDSPSD